MALYRVPVNLTWPGSGSPGVNVWSVRAEAGAFALLDELQGAVDAIHTFYETAVGALVEGTAITIGEVSERESQERADVDWEPLTSLNGSGAAPPALQICIGWRTSIAARRGMGRTFIGPLGKNVMDADGTITAASVTDFRTAAQALVDSSASATNGWGIGVWGLQNPAPAGTTDYGPLPRVHRDFTGVRIKDQFAILRSRRD